MKARLELVTWRDAFSNDEEKTPKDFLCKTVGWAKGSGRWLVVTSERTPTGERGITRIPIENVVSRRPLS